MIKVIKFDEKWDSSYHIRGRAVEVFKNPDRAELMSVANLSAEWKSVRGLIDENGDVYVFHSVILHNDMEEYMNRDFPARVTIDLKNRLVWCQEPEYVGLVLRSPWMRKHCRGFEIMDGEHEGLLVERWVDYVSYRRGKTGEVVVNPDRAEMVSMRTDSGEYIRFIADAKAKEMYVFPADLLHREAAQKVPALSKYLPAYEAALNIVKARMNMDPDIPISAINPTVLFGTGKVDRSGGVTMIGSDALANMPSAVMALYDPADFVWAERYVRDIQDMMREYIQMAENPDVAWEMN